MRAYIVTTLIGSFAVSESKKVVAFKLFSKEPSLAAEKFKLSEFEIIEEEKKLMQDSWKKGYKEFVYSVRKLGVKHAEPGNQFEQFIKDNLRKFAVDYKFVKDQVEFNQFLTKANLEIAKVQIKKSIGRDQLIIHASSAVEELDKSINIMVERLREWYGLHFPEMDRTISDHEKYAKLVEKFGSREKIDESELKQFAEKSMGVDLNENDVRTIQLFAKRIGEQYKFREDISKYIEKTLDEVAPNMKELAGTLLAAKLIAKGGGLEKLARSPSSTIQLLGAEKALFRYLHGHGKSPKYGLLYSHQLIQNAPRELKGKIARLLASKLSIAAKIDFYSHENRSEKMKKELQERVKEILQEKKDRSK